MVFPIPPPEFALDWTPAVQTAHCAADHKGSRRIIKEKNIFLMLFMHANLQKKLKTGSMAISLNRQLPL